MGEERELSGTPGHAQFIAAIPAPPRASMEKRLTDILRISISESLNLAAFGQQRIRAVAGPSDCLTLASN